MIWHHWSYAMLPGFMVGLSNIGTAANQIGMNQSSWASCYQCNNIYGTCTAVQGGSPYDQFSSFRNVSLAKIVASDGSNCRWISNSAMLFGGAQYPVQQIACDYPAGLLNITMVMNALAFGMIPTATTLSLVSEGMLAWTPGSPTGASCSQAWQFCMFAIVLSLAARLGCNISLTCLARRCDKREQHN